jgi:hypothetical protein
MKGTEEKTGIHFVEVRSYRTLPKAGSTDPAWQRTPLFAEDHERRSIRGNKYVYAFRFGHGKRPTLEAEYFANEQGNLFKVDGAKRLSTAPTKCGPGRSIGFVERFPVFANGERYWWWFFCSRTRLTCAALRQLAMFEWRGTGDYAECVGWNGTTFLLRDLRDTSNFVQSKDGDLGLPVMDVISVAEHLSLESRFALQHYNDFLDPSKTKDAQKQQEITNRITKYVLANAIIDLSHSAPKLLNKLRRAQEPWDVRFDFNTEVNKRKLRRDQAAFRHCSLVRSKPMELLYALYKLDKTYGIGDWMVESGPAFHQVLESLPGQALAEDPPNYLADFIKAYTKPVANDFSSRESYNVARRSVTGLAYYITAFAPLLLTAAMKQGAQLSEEVLTSIFTKLNRDLDAGVFTVVGAGSAAEAAARNKKFYEAVDHLEQTKLAFAREQGFLRIDEAAVKEFQTAYKARLKVSAIDVFKKLVDTVYYVWTLHEYSEKPKLKTYEQLKALSAVNSMLKIYAWEWMAKSSSPGLAWWGAGGKRFAPFAGAVLDAAAGAYEGWELARETGEYGAGASALASGIASAVHGLAAVGWVNPPVALAATGVMLLTSALTVMLKNSDLENFVEHCIFGKEYGKSFWNDVHPKWALGTFSEWADGSNGLDKQIRTLYGLLCAFTPKSDGLGGITVDLPSVDWDDRLAVDVRRGDLKLGVIQIASADPWMTPLAEWIEDWTIHPAYTPEVVVRKQSGSSMAMSIAFVPEDPRTLLSGPLQYRVVLHKGRSTNRQDVISIPVNDPEPIDGSLSRQQVPRSGRRLPQRHNGP